MILCYHKVDLTARTHWWVSVDKFNRDMAALQACDVVPLSEYDPQNPRHAVVSFDGTYENVADFALPILKKWNYPFEMFIIGDYVGRMNDFDQHVEPPCAFASMDALRRLVEGGGRVQWHTATHRRLVGLPPAELDRELTVPTSLRSAFGAGHFDWFAYPHGEHDDAIEQRVKQDFSGALSCVAGDDSDRHRLNRTIVAEDTPVVRSRVSIIVANYNYGSYLREAVDSVLAQTVPPDELLIIDDASTDRSREVIHEYDDVARICINEKNLGIVGNFRKAIELTSGDYIAFLGADNRFRCDYVERCRAALDRDSEAAIAYTDTLLFGPRAGLLAEQISAEKVGQSLLERSELYLWRFPEPEADPAAQIKRGNFIHGSSMYRRSWYERVGGYRATEIAEDWNLFERMLQAGGRAIHVRHPVLEYRQHSAAQANTVLVLELENVSLRKEIARLRLQCDDLKNQYSEMRKNPLVRLARSFDKLKRKVGKRARKAGKRRIG